MSAAKGNRNAAKKLKRLDVHMSIANTKEGQYRSKLERYMQQMDKPYTEQDMKERCRRVIYDWIESLPE